MVKKDAAVLARRLWAKFFEELRDFQAGDFDDDTKTKADLGVVGPKGDHGEESKIVEHGDATQWPWGGHHTTMLGHMDAAARRYYGANFDPSDWNTAPTNASVSEWLQTQRKVSKTMADAIASMLRPDGLPTGPRK